MTEFYRDTYDFGDGKIISTRSRWEMNWAFYLEFLKKQKQIRDWRYEPERYDFIEYRNGQPRVVGPSYLPDFEITNNDDTFYLQELKGRKQGMLKLKRMKRFYPAIKVVLIQKDEYMDIKKKFGRLLNFL